MVILILWAPGAHAAGEAAKTLPTFDRLLDLEGDSPAARDEAAIRLASLMRRGACSPLAFRLGLLRVRTMILMLGSFFLEIFSWLLVVAGPGVSRWYGVFMKTTGPSGRAAATILAKPLLAKLRSLYRRGVFSMRDVRCAAGGVLPSDPRAVWCVQGLAGPVYTIAHRGQEIHVRRLSQQTQAVLPPDWLRNLQVIEGLKSDKKGTQRIDIPRTGFGRIALQIPDWEQEGKPFVLSGMVHPEALHFLLAWQRDELTGVDLSQAKYCRLAVVALLLSLSVLLMPIVVYAVRRTLRTGGEPRTADSVVVVVTLFLTPLLFTIGGIVAGHVARARIRRNVLLHGKGLALAALWIGYILLATSLIMGATIGLKIGAEDRGHTLNINFSDSGPGPKTARLRSQVFGPYTRS